MVEEGVLYHSAAKTPADDTDQVMVTLNLKEILIILSYHH